ncbi:MAG: insulinase family protein [Paracoccaceae bacterium]|nr:insulinase family protein [Paracoccaceae bacterium]
MWMIVMFRARLAAGLAVLAVLIALPAQAVEIQDLTSPGGTGFWLVEEPSIPIVALEISFAGGARHDPEDRPGLANLMRALLDEGAGDMDALAFAEARDALSARFGFSAGRDAMDASARMLVETLEPSVELLATALAKPRFDPEPLERVRGQLLASIAQSATEPDSVAGEAWSAGTFPEHPYGLPSDGTAESVQAITRDDLAAAHGMLLTRVNARIAIVGAIDAEKAGWVVDTVLAGLPEGKPFAATETNIAPPPGLTVIEMDVPQSAAIFGQKGLYRDDPDFIPAYVMNYVLGGGGFTSRLMTEVREKRGLAYGVYSYLSVRDEAALYLGSVRTANERMAESLDVIRGEWARMADEGVSEDELERAKKYLTGAFPLSLDSNAKIARYLVFMQEEALGIDYLDRRNGLIEAVTVEDIKRVAARLLDPDALSIVVVGKPEGL